MRLTVEVDDEGPASPLPGDGEALIAFMSFAVLRGFGAEHPLLALAERLEAEHGVRLGPLTVFYEGSVEDAEDEEKLAMAWQEAGPLAETAAEMATAIAASERCATLVTMAGAQGLGDQARELGLLASRAADRGRRIRLSYAL